MFKSIKRYMLIWFSFFRASLIMDLEFRSNLVLKVFTDFLWYFAQFSVFEVMYGHTPTLGGWHVEQLRIFLMLLFLVDGIYMILFSENLDQIPGKVLRGELDLVLTKPIHSQFIFSTMKLNTAYIVNLGLVSTGLAWSLTQLEGGMPWTKLPYLLIALPAGLSVMYASKMIFAASSIYLGNGSQIMMLWYNLYRLGTRPDLFYPKLMRLFVMTVMPMAFIASVPARIIVDPLNVWLIVSSAFMGILALWISSLYWNRALSKYVSASS